MLFPTPAFATFLTVLLALLLMIRGDRVRKLVLLLASYVFYMWWNPIFVLPLLVTTAIDYQAGRMLENEERPGRRRLLLTLSVIANLGLLAYFKYYDFFVENIEVLASVAGLHVTPVLGHLILPVGISFYTFHSMSYTIDVYRREIPVCRSPLRFALFITFFPVLVAGPILRAKQFLPQLERRMRLRLTPGIVMLIVRGLAKKVLVADNISPFVDTIFDRPDRWPSVIIWLATIGFAIQIYCDFSGYSDIARGLARIFGFDIPVNFDRPYFARNPAEFWRRWHISLSTWLRDYLYIPLGGSRGGRLATYRNLMITMLLGGLWHGASWNFVLWGFMHGAMLTTHRMWREWRANAARLDGPMSRAGAWAALQVFILFSWLVFRITDTGRMLVAMKKFVFFDFNLHILNIGLGSVSFGFTLAVMSAFLALHFGAGRSGDLDERIARASFPVAAVVCAGIGLLFVFFWPMAEKPFIYFQF
jgi:alginate O-acetyltransferase complex protein AlgI